MQKSWDTGWSPPPPKGIGLQQSFTKKLGWAGLGEQERGLQLIKATAETAPGWPGAAFLEVSTGGCKTQAEPSSTLFFIQIFPHGPRFRPQQGSRDCRFPPLPGWISKCTSCGCGARVNPRCHISWNSPWGSQKHSRQVCHPLLGFSHQKSITPHHIRQPQQWPTARLRGRRVPLLA